MGPPLPTTARLVNKFSRFFGNLPLGMASSLLFPRFRQRLPKEGLIVATTNGMGLALGLGRLLGLVRVRVLLLAMGVLPHDASNWRRWLVLKLAHQLDIVTISRPEQEAVQRLLPNQQIGYLPFGVDCDFWFPNEEYRPAEEYVLAIGNDLNRDWETLVAAWCDEFPKLKIVTSLPVITNGNQNIEVIRGDWRSAVLSDESIRELYWGALFIVIPLRETIQPAGQSVCLQAMACGKAVIMSAISGLWNTDVMQNERNLLLTNPRDIPALREVVSRLIADSFLRNKMVRNGRKTIEDLYNVENMSKSFGIYLTQISEENAISQENPSRETIKSL